MKVRLLTPVAAPALAGALAGALAIACHTPNPKTEVELRNLEGYWAVDPAVGDTQYLAPVVRFELVNKAATARSIDATATFRREGDNQTWPGTARVSPVKGKPLERGHAVAVILKPEGEGRYTYRGPVEAMLRHSAFKDFTAEVFIMVGGSPWTKFADVRIERRLGSRTVEAFK